MRVLAISAIALAAGVGFNLFSPVNFNVLRAPFLGGAVTLATFVALGGLS